MPDFNPDPRILVVDDDAELQALLAILLREQGWSPLTALTLQEGERLLLLYRPEVVLLDVMLTDGSGLDACCRWRTLLPEAGILMLSARGGALDKVLGLEMGADDYLAKPFEKRELIARVHALLRRRLPWPGPAAGEAVAEMALDEIVIDMARCEARVRGQVVALTAIEYKLLVVLARTPGQAHTREGLQSAVQPGNYRPLDRTVDVQMGRLRRKLQAAGPGRDWITTVRGQGYAFEAAGSPGQTPVTA